MTGAAWFDKTLGEVILLQRGFDLTEKSNDPGPYPVISSGGISYRTATPKVDGPGVVTGRKGVLGKVHFSEGPYWPHDTTLWVKDFKGNDPRYVYYLLHTLPLAHLDAGASNPTLNRNHAHLLRVHVPDVGTQRKIAVALASFDDLIENNQRRIELLDEMARLIYREWFVHFRFPGHEHVELVDSGLGPIPAEWGRETLADAAHLVMGQSPKSEFYNDDGIGLPFHQGVTNFGVRYPEHKKWCTEESRIAEEGDILVSVRAPVGRINVAPDRLVIGRGLAALRSRRGTQVHLFESLREVFAEEDSMGGGTIFKAVTKTDLERISLVRPPAALVESFEAAVGPMFELVGKLTFQVRVLSKARNLVLPRLIAGELDVSDLDLDLEPVA